MKNNIYIWDNGVKVLETYELAWRIIDKKYYSITAKSEYIDNYDATFYYESDINNLSIGTFNFYAPSFKEANKFVLNFLKQNNISLDETIYITPNIEKRRKRIPKINRLLKK